MTNINHRFLLLLYLKIILISLGILLLVVGFFFTSAPSASYAPSPALDTIAVNLLSLVGILLNITGIVIPLPKTNTSKSSSSRKNDVKISTLIRYPYLECPSSSLINRRFSLYVRILIESPAPEIKAMEIEDMGILEKLPEVEIVLRARGFEIEETNTRIVQVKRDDNTEERFVLIPLQLGEQEIRVDFYQNGRRIGTARHNIIIYAKEESGKVEVSQPQDITPMELNTQFLVPPFDLELCIELDKHDNKTLYFTLSSIKSEIDYHQFDVGQFTPQTSPEEKMKSVYQELGHLAESLSRKGTPVDLYSYESNFKYNEKIAEERLVSVGSELWKEYIPDKLKQEYWKFKSNVKSFLITSDEPWIPWEIIKPYRFDGDGKEQQDPFWCEQFAMSRWLSGPGTADELSAELVVTVIFDYSISIISMGCENEKKGLGVN